MIIEQDFVIKGAPFKHDLTSIDQHMLDMFSRRIFCFALPPTSSKNEIIQILMAALQACVDQMPFLAGSITGAIKVESNKYRRLIQAGAAHLIVKDLSSQYDFATFAAQDFSSELLPIEELSPAPRFHFLKPGELLDVCRIQASFVKGGLLVNFCLNHVAMDGTGITTFIKLFRGHCYALQDVVTYSKERVFSECQPVPFTDRSVINKQSVDRKAQTNVDLLKHIYDIADGMREDDGKQNYAPPPSTGPPPPPSITRTFLFPASQVSRLIADASRPSQQEDGTPRRPAPAMTAISALLWCNITLVRLKSNLLDASTTTTVPFLLPVDIRRRTSPPLPPGYIGNAIIMARADLPLSSLTASSLTSSLPASANAIRAAITSTTSVVVNNFISTLFQLPHPGQQITLRDLDIMSSDPKTVLVTSQLGFEPYGWEWGDKFGEFKALCFPSGEGLQCCYVLPVRVNGTWEVAVALRGDVMAVLGEDEAWLSYTHESQQVLAT